MIVRRWLEFDVEQVAQDFRREQAARELLRALRIAEIGALTGLVISIVMVAIAVWSTS